MTLTVYRYSMHHFLLQQHWGAVSSLFCWTHHVHTRQCSHGQRSCDCQPHFNSSDLRSHSKTKSRMSVRAAVTRRFRASKCASVALSGGEKKLQGCLSILTAWRLVSSKTKEEVGDLSGSRLFYELALEITWHHFYYTLFNRGEF